MLNTDIYKFAILLISVDDSADDDRSLKTKAMVGDEAGVVETTHVARQGDC